MIVRGRASGGRDAGQTMILILGLVVIAAALVAVVADVSKVFLTARALSAAADAAAATAASGTAQDALYSAGADAALLPLDDAAARQRVEDYAARAGLPTRFPGFAVVGATTDGETATVTLAARVAIPFGAVVSDRWAAGVPVTVTAAARSPVTG